MFSRYRVYLVTGLVILVSAAAHEVIPWPKGIPPSGETFSQGVEDAMSREQLERFEEFLEADERGEDREHITVFQQRIDDGWYDVETLFNFGDALFEHEFSLIDGLGTGQLGIRRVHDGTRGGLDTYACASCHSLGGADGAGTFQQNVFLYGDGASISTTMPRNAPSLLGVGLIQSLAADMTIELATIKQETLRQAQMTGESMTNELVAKSLHRG